MRTLDPIKTLQLFPQRGPVKTIQRIFYAFLDGCDPTNGPIEFTFEDGSALWCDAGPDGETLVIYNGPWIDPFQEPLSRENQRFVAEHGKWLKVDVSSQAPYQMLIGKPVKLVHLIHNQFNTLAGFILEVDDVRLIGIAECDEFYILDDAGFRNRLAQGWAVND